MRLLARLAPLLQRASIKPRIEIRGNLDLLKRAVEASSQGEVARHLGVSTTMISQAVRGIYPSSTTRLMQAVIGAYASIKPRIEIRGNMRRMDPPVSCISRALQ